MGRMVFLWDFQAFVFSYVLADLPSIQVTSHCLIPCIPRSSSGETTGTLVGSTFTTPSTHFYSSILSTRPNHRSLLSCKHSIVLFNFGLVLRFSAEILSAALTLHIHLTTLLSFLSSLITFSLFTGQVQLPYSITLHTHAEYNQHFTCKGKPLLSEFTSSTPDPFITLSVAPHEAPIVSPW